MDEPDKRLEEQIKSWKLSDHPARRWKAVLQSPQGPTCLVFYTPNGVARLKMRQLDVKINELTLFKRDEIFEIGYASGVIDMTHHIGCPQFDEIITEHMELKESLPDMTLERCVMFASKWIGEQTPELPTSKHHWARFEPEHGLVMLNCCKPSHGDNGRDPIRVSSKAFTHIMYLLAHPSLVLAVANPDGGAPQIASDEVSRARYYGCLCSYTMSLLYIQKYFPTTISFEQLFYREYQCRNITWEDFNTRADYLFEMSAFAECNRGRYKVYKSSDYRRSYIDLLEPLREISEHYPNTDDPFDSLIRDIGYPQFTPSHIKEMLLRTPVNHDKGRHYKWMGDAWIQSIVIWHTLALPADEVDRLIKILLTNRNLSRWFDQRCIRPYVAGVQPQQGLNEHSKGDIMEMILGYIYIEMKGAQTRESEAVLFSTLVFFSGLDFERQSTLLSPRRSVPPTLGSILPCPDPFTAEFGYQRVTVRDIKTKIK